MSFREGSANPLTNILDILLKIMGSCLSGTVDGRNPKQPPGMYKKTVNNGISTISTGAGFLPSTVSLVVL